MSLSDEQVERYSRQILLKEIGPKRQEALLERTVLVIGAGGLGSPALLYLAAAGVGAIVIADGDVVDRTNLGRQIIHDEGVIDELKTVSAAAKIHALNPDVAVQELGRLEGDALRGAIAAVDVVIECSDSIPTKFAVNDAALDAGVPAVIGGILRWEGQVMVVRRGAACWRCLFEQEPTAEEMPPACSEAGVSGALAGVIGSMQAVEAMKLLLALDGTGAGSGRDAAGGITIYDAWESTTRRVEVSPRAGCPACRA